MVSSKKIKKIKINGVFKKKKKKINKKKKKKKKLFE